MTRKDYILIARVCAEARVAVREYKEPVYAIDTLTFKLADMLAVDNPRFDRQRFLVACAAT